MNLNRFAAEIVDLWRRSDFVEIEGADFQELVIKHGLLVERTATAEDVAAVDDDWREFEVGDEIVADSPELVALRLKLSELEKG